MGAPRWRSSMTIEEARQQAQAEGLVLLVAENKAGYFGVNHKPARPKVALPGECHFSVLLFYFHKQLRPREEALHCTVASQPA